MTWGTPYGFLGQSTYGDFVSNLEVSPPSWKFQSYSLWFVFGDQGQAPVEQQVSQAQAAQALTLGATVGAVAASGPAGIADSTSTAYAPAGYDPLYGALTFVADHGALTATLNVAAATSVDDPLIVVRGFSGSASSGYPSHLLVDGVELIADRDYFPSLWGAQQQLWITLRRSLPAGAHTLKIS
jgi:hypothetical protein